MHLVFERSNGRFKSNCNILALSWMPYYDEAKFRQAHFDYHQRLLAQWTGPLGRAQSRALGLAAAGQAPLDPAAGNNPLGLQELFRQQQQHGPGSPGRQPRRQRHWQEPAEVDALPPALLAQDPAARNQNDDQNVRLLTDQLGQHLAQTRKLSNSRLCEQIQRYAHIKSDPSSLLRPSQFGCSSRGTSGGADCQQQDSSPRPAHQSTLLNDELDEKYGRSSDFGWLAIGNVGKIVGVSLTSIVSPPSEPDGRKSGSRELAPVGRAKQRRRRAQAADLIVLDDENAAEDSTGLGHKPDATASQRPDHLTSATQLRPDRKGARHNYNLRGHLDEIILVKWNELYQKLATVDSKGNVLIWCKSNDKFTIQTPFYNQSKSVADFKWSNDGKTALICYTDSFILVGGSSGQRHWHSMLNLEDYHITCAAWAPNDERLLLGVSNGNVVQIDLPQSELTELVVGQANIRVMCWSSCELNLRHLDEGRKQSASVGEDGDPVAGGEPKCDSQRGQATTTTTSEQQAKNSTIVNRRRLSRNCALFCRYRPIPAPDANQPPAPSPTVSPPRHPGRPPDERDKSRQTATLADSCRDILAIDFADNTIKLFDGGLDDAKPREIHVQLESYLMAWSSDGKLLAVGGFNISTSAPSIGYLRCKYLNSLKFYSQTGRLVYEYQMNYTRYPITALAWAHEDRRLFVATGPRLHCAKVFLGVPRLSLMATSRLCKSIKQMDKADVLKSLIASKRVVERVLSWQSFNCSIDLTRQAKDDETKDTKLHQQQHPLTSASSDSAAGSSTSRSAGAGPGRIALMQHAGQRDESAAESSNDDSAHHKQQPLNQPASLANNININNFRLPAKLKVKIDQMFLQTLRQPHDEQLSLADVAWQVPKNQQRQYCTLICYTYELPDVGSCLGHQYKARELAEQQHQRLQSHKRTGSAGGPLGGPPTHGSQMDVASDQYKIFILYIESQGSLIPILKARRIGFLKPEFVIFDPEESPAKHFQRHLKVADMSSEHSGKPAGRAASDQSKRPHLCLKPNLLDMDQCRQLHQAAAPFSSPRVQRGDPTPTERTQGGAPVADNLCQQTLAYALRQQLKLPPPQDHSTSASKLRAYTPHEIIMDPQLMRSLKRGQIQMQASGSLSHHHRNHLQRRAGCGKPNKSLASDTAAVVAAQATHLASKARQSPLSSGHNKSLPESSELVRIKSNIWGTKFKLQNVGNRMIGVRAVLGSVNYKASLLHLQPRQIFLNLKDMTNYCCLCSMHHHTKMEPRRSRPTGSRRSGRSGSLLAGERGQANGDSLMDQPIGLHPSPRTPLRSSPRRQSRLDGRQRQLNSPERTQSEPRARKSDKVMLPVGDNIRVAPKLEPNQRYQFAGGQAAGLRVARPRPQLQVHSLVSGRSSMRHRFEDASYSRAQFSPPLAGPSQTAASPPAMPGPEADDILTLSLDQGDQVRVEMSSLSSLGGGASSRSHGHDHQGQSSRVNEFLQANKTLKSIQTITKMIVDLSSKAQIENSSSRLDLSQQEAPSPYKLLKTGPNSASPSASPVKPSQYIPPDTPVHRPRRRLASSSYQSSADSVQSASSTPLRSSKFAQQKRLENAPSLLLSDAPLPPPPPSVPFRRKLSTSAKRLFDGSLRSLVGLGGVGGYLSASGDLDSDDCETLVERRAARASRAGPRVQPNLTARTLANRHHCQSQPCTPLRSPRDDCPSSSRKQSTNIDLAQLRLQVVERLRQSTSWVSAGSSGRSFAWPNLEKSRDRSKRRSRRFSERNESSQSCTKQSHWVHKGNSSGALLQRFNGQELAQYPSSSFSSLCSSSSSASSSSFSSSSCYSGASNSSGSFSSSASFRGTDDDDETRASDRSEAFGFLDQALRAKLFRKRAAPKFSASARDLNSDADRQPQRRLQHRLAKGVRGGERSAGLEQVTPSRVRPERRRHRRRRRRETRKSICQNANCCCSREFKLNNRPPVWNEQSQVYQLDFGGRVTQESAKNLQIDFNGNLALQFGRIDKCTYTLDYKYPFNAVQAMSVALASLTQRLK